VRELENCLTRAVVHATGNVIRPEHLRLRSDATESPAELRTLADITRRHVERALVAAEGNKTKAAEILGISKPKLYRLLEKDRDDWARS
jgi:DNA-binding NtrC family response regulator